MPFHGFVDALKQGGGGFMGGVAVAFFQVDINAGAPRVFLHDADQLRQEHVLRPTCAREQRNIIYSFVSYLKISPVKLQFKVLTRRADINRHLETLREEMRQETDERCLALQKDYESLIRRIGSREAITRRFFIIFEYEPFAANRGNEENDAISALTTAVRTAKT